jgi:hypothetical protein
MYRSGAALQIIDIPGEGTCAGVVFTSGVGARRIARDVSAIAAAQCRSTGRKKNANLRSSTLIGQNTYPQLALMSVD